MAITSKQQIIIDKLYALYESKGFICEEEALDLLSVHNATLTEIDLLLDKLLSMGAIFVEDDNQDNEDSIDKAQIDYDEIYDEIVRISPGEEPLVDYIRNTRPPQNREWRTLIPQAKSGNTYALNRLFDMYLRVVVRTAYNYYKDGKINLDDAIQEGALGLMRALRNFDPTKHENPASYVPLWIIQHIDRAIADTGRTIRIPVHTLEIIKKFERATKQLTVEYERKPTEDELAEIMDLSKEEVLSLKRYGQEPLSLEEIINQELAGTLKELAFDDDSSSPFEATSKLLLQKTVYEVLETLTSREREILFLRKGFFDGEEKTLEEVGGMFNVTRERIRQIEAKALRKLRHPSRSRKLRDWSDTNEIVQNENRKDEDVIKKKKSRQEKSNKL